MRTDEREAFDDFARARGPGLLRYGLALTGEPALAADLVQEALVRTVAAWPRVRMEDPEGYVRVTMARLSVSWWRRSRRKSVVRDVPEGAYDDPPPPDLRHWRALAAVPPRQRAVLVLRFCEDRSEADTAAALGCSRGTVKSQTSKGLARLRAVLGDEVAAWR